MKNIAVYGGAFNPPTLWHKYVIESIITKTNIDQIILNPDGERLDKDYKVEKSIRSELMDIFFKELKSEWLDLDIDKYFFNWGNNRDTTIMQVKEYYKEILWFEPRFVFGTDVIPNMPTWQDNTDKYIEKELKKIFIPRHWVKYDLKWFENYIIVDTPLVDISSTMVKQNLIENKQSVDNLLSKNVAKYVIENDLYV
jgi:nicotinate-nucleotide adenylyltransferase